MSNKNSGSISKITIINLLNVFLLKGIDFITTPLFTRLLGTDNYGKYSLYSSWAAIVVCFMGLNIQSSIASAKYKYDNKYQEFKKCVLLIGIALSLIIFAVALGIMEKLVIFLKLPQEVVVVLFLYSMSSFIIEFCQNSLIYEKKACSNLFLSLFISLSTAILSIVLITLFDSNEKYLGRIYGMSFSYIGIAIAIVISVIIKNPLVVKKDYIVYGITMGVPIVFHLLAHNILNQSDRIILQRYNFSDADIGIYSLYCSFAAIIKVILSALNNSWCPFYYDYVSSGDYKKIEQKSKNYIEFYTVIVAGFILLGREVGMVYAGEDFWDGLDYIPLLALANYFIFMYQFSVNTEFFYKKTVVIACSSLIAAISNIILNIIFIPSYGVIGAVFTTTFSYFLLFCLHYLYVKIKMNCYRVTVDRFFIPLLMILVCMLVFYLWKDLCFIRWIIAIIIGLIELIKIVKRKTLF